LSSLFSSDRRKLRPIHRIAYPISLRGVFVWRWAHQHHGDAPTNNKANCRVYGINFYEVVVARQAAATCGQGTERQRILDALDSEINVFNGLIAAQCAI